MLKVVNPPDTYNRSEDAMAKNWLSALEESLQVLVQHE